MARLLLTEKKRYWSLSRILTAGSLACCLIAAISIGNCLIDISQHDTLHGSERGRYNNTSMSELSDYYTYQGQIHFHTTYSDGSGTYQEVIDIADSLGIDFIIPADHNTTKPMHDGWDDYDGDLLVIPAIEASADNGGGHFLIIGDHVPLVRSKQVPSDSVFFDSLRNGNTIILAHVFHPSHNDWENWDIGEFAGIEMFNFDENWRSMLMPYRLQRLLAALVVYPFNPAAINHVITRPSRQLAKFDELNRERKVIGIGVTDAHASVDLPGGKVLRFPGYESMFNLVRTYIVCNEPYSGDYSHDRAITLSAIGQGNMFIGFPGYGDPSGFVFTATSDTDMALMGDSLFVDTGQSAEITCVLPDSADVRIIIYHDGEQEAVYSNTGQITYETDEPGAYRIEAVKVSRMLPLYTTHEHPWIYTNPIYIYSNSNLSELSGADSEAE